MPSFFSDCGTDIFTFSYIRMWNALYNFLWIRNKRNAKEFKQCLNTKKKSWASLFKLGQQLPHCHWTLESPCLPNPRVTLFASPPTTPFPHSAWTTFSNISVISWQSVLWVEETRSTRRKSPTCRKSRTNFYHIMLYRVHLVWLHR